jgi:hypothetical protein
VKYLQKDPVPMAQRILASRREDSLPAKRLAVIGKRLIA